MNYIFLIIGFIMLIKGADFFVDGSSAIAKKMGIPAVIVGLTIVSLGTSAPELAVSLISALNGNNEITMGNVLGSNLFNTLAVLGCTAIASPLIINKKVIKKDMIVNVISIFALYFLAFEGFGFLGKDNFLSRLDGIILLIVCIGYISYLIHSVRNTNAQVNNINDVVDSIEVETAVELTDSKQKDESNISKNIIISIIGVLGIIFGGKLVVDSASNIALTFGLSEKLVGLTIVAIGTSLPELVTSLVAVKKGENEIALGNVLGSNTFNILLILGTSSFISPMVLSPSLAVDLLFLIVVTLFIMIIIFFNNKSIKKLNRFEGLILLSLYIGYMTYIIIRN